MIKCDCDPESNIALHLMSVPVESTTWTIAVASRILVPLLTVSF